MEKLAFTGKVFISTPEDTGPAYTPMNTMSWSTLLLVVAHSGDRAGVPAGMPSVLANLPLHSKAHGRRSDGRTFVLHRLSDRPHAFLLKGFLSAEECDALIESAKRSGFEAAETTGKTNARRHCEVALLTPSQERVLASIQSDAARVLLSSEALRTEGGGVEALNVLHYQPGGEYTLHYDAMNNPRILTILYYLNGKGETWFPLADSPQRVARAFADPNGVVSHASTLDPATDGLRVKPTGAGDALAFFNFDETGEPDQWALHAGLEVVPTEEKWLGTHFFNHPKLCAGYESYVL